jgi:hypothetical protein
MQESLNALTQSAMSLGEAIYKDQQAQSQAGTGSAAASNPAEEIIEGDVEKN